MTTDQSRPALSRRRLLALAAAAGASPLASAASPADAMDLRPLSPLGFQAHTMRVPLARDFPGTLRVMRAMGFQAIELASFPGFVGDRRGDFTPLQNLAPARIRRIVADAGLACTSAHFLPPEFAPDKFARSLDWARGVGLDYMVYAGLDLPVMPTMDQLKAQLDVLNEAGARVQAAGLKMGFHSDAHVWRTLDGQSAVEEMMRRLDPKAVRIQMDFGTIVQTGADGAAILDRYPDRFFSVHLRDAKRPADTWAYLPAEPLGAGQVDWAAVMRAARRAKIGSYVVEMTRYPGGVFDAMKQSYDYLSALPV
jgi:sugar phosphate isomerase/epimerase